MKEPKTFEFDILKITRGLEVHPYHTTEVFWKWSAKAQREYTKTNTTDARDSFVFRYPIEATLEEE